jgi:hypothetical protein
MACFANLFGFRLGTVWPSPIRLLHSGGVSEAIHIPTSYLLHFICLSYDTWHAYTRILLNPRYYRVNQHSFTMSRPLGCFSKIRHFTSVELSVVVWPQSIYFLYVFSLHPLTDKHAYHHIQSLFCGKYLVQYMILYESPFWNHNVMYLCSSLHSLQKFNSKNRVWLESVLH